MQNPKYVNVKGIKTRYFDEGQGEPLVLIHGGNFGNEDLTSPQRLEANG